MSYNTLSGVVELGREEGNKGELLMEFEGEEYISRLHCWDGNSQGYKLNMFLLNGIEDDEELCFLIATLKYF